LQQSRIGIIDVGSNTVRLVVFDGFSRVPDVVFNEKVLCGLGRSIASTGRLHPQGMELAFAAIRRFVSLARHMNVATIDMVATAAVREAENGADFAATVERECGERLRILSGEEEARFAALGVQAGEPEAAGLVGDLGGGSLELAVLGEEGRKAVSLAIGPLRLADIHGGSRRKARRAIDKALDGVPWLAEGVEAFYAVGGAWRALARLHMTQSGYPLSIIHNYEIPLDDIMTLARRVFRGGKGRLILNGVAEKRLATLPLASLVLYRLLKRIVPRRFVISAMGLREGMVHDRLGDEIRRHDPLLMVCRDMAAREGRFAQHGDELMAWMDPLFGGEAPQDTRLRRAACLLSDIGWRGHPNYRAELALFQVLHGHFFGIDHWERAQIGLALFACYGGDIAENCTRTAHRLLSEAQTARAEKIGLALRLGQRLSGGAGGVLADCRLSNDGGLITLSVARAQEHLLGEVVERRLQALAGAMAKTGRIKIVD